jgi:replication factor C subunit 3/5
MERAMSLPWVEKYRPETLEGVVSHQDIITTLGNLITHRKLPHLIFYGPPGTGKTTTILACANKMYGPDYKSMILELNGSDERGINVVREQIKEFSSSQFMMRTFMGASDGSDGSALKLVILDEADSMTYDAQFALRRVIENYSGNTRFCLICNYLTKIIPALQSRCTIFKFSPIEAATHMAHIRRIANSEGVRITDECVRDVVELAEGDMRKSINIVQSLHMAYPDIDIDIDALYNTVGYPHPGEYQEVMGRVVDAVATAGLRDAFATILEFKEHKNLSVNDILKEFAAYVLASKMPKLKTAIVLDKLARIEVQLVGNVNQDLQLAAIVSTLIN